jgi:Phage integrase family
VFEKAVEAVQAAVAEQRANELAQTGVATTPKFPTVTPHDLRHTAASLAVSSDANVKAVQRMRGHAKASMTLDVYADLFDDDLDIVADRLAQAIRSTAKQTRAEAGRWGGPRSDPLRTSCGLGPRGDGQQRSDLLMYGRPGAAFHGGTLHIG